jgi:hypothetical protein
MLYGGLAGIAISAPGAVVAANAYGLPGVLAWGAAEVTSALTGLPIPTPGGAARSTAKNLAGNAAEQLAKNGDELKNAAGGVADALRNAPKGPVERGWLQFWEGRGIGNSRGHVIAQLVGKSDADLIARIGSNKKKSAASSFTDQATAEAVIGGAIRQNRTELNAWLRTAQQGDRLPLPYSGTDVIGRGIKKGQSVVGDRTNAKIILQALGDGKYHILTAFPE